ncbi:Vegetative incompatibility HET-E-1-like protein [Cladobotryum mycophilum]|uniref:Vegetative incompatibility HET-E-1-like protein n=1 Tax=Cladobotryum mycophilum TaxID=491253 RepID=A0ABR0SGU3_9HYPO
MSNNVKLKAGNFFSFRRNRRTTELREIPASPIAERTQTPSIEHQATSSPTPLEFGHNTPAPADTVDVETEPQRKIATDTESEPAISPPLQDTVQPQDTALLSGVSVHLDDNPTISESLWDDAYRYLRIQNKNLVAWYEAALSSFLESGPNFQMISSQAPDNAVGHEKTGLKRSQMKAVVEKWCNQTIEANQGGELGQDVSNKNGKIFQIIRKNIHSTEDAATAWAGLCLASAVLFNPAIADKESCSGLIFIISRMKWYTYLPKLLLVNDIEEPKTKVVSLYIAILSFLMKITCSLINTLEFEITSAIHGAGFWDYDLKSIIEAERGVILVAEEEVKIPLEKLVKFQVDEEIRLEPDTVSSPKGDLAKALKALTMEAPILRTLQSGMTSDKITKYYEFIRSRPEYKTFLNWKTREGSILCIRGGAGIGKTSLLPKFIREFGQQTNNRCVSYFFFDHSKPELSTIASALKHLIWHIIESQPSMLPHLWKKLESTEREQLGDLADTLALFGILYNIFKDDSFQETYLVLDALEECRDQNEWPGLQGLLRFIRESTTWTSNIRWMMVVDCDSNHIESAFQQTSHLPLFLDIPGQLPSDGFGSYIRHKVAMLSDQKRYDTALKQHVITSLFRLPYRNYLSIDIICTALEAEDNWYASTLLAEVVQLDKLEPLYKLMVAKLDSLPREDGDFCKRLLRLVAISHRSLHLNELKKLVELKPKIGSHEADITAIVSKCAVFLRKIEGSVSFHNFSAQRFVQQEIITMGMVSQEHSYVTRRCLIATTEFLSNSDEGGVSIHQFGRKEDNDCSSYAYALIHWMTHLMAIQNVQEETETCDQVTRFLENSLVTWAASLISQKQFTVAASMMQVLNFRIQQSNMTDKSELRVAIREACALFHLHLSLNSETKSPSSIEATVLFFPAETQIARTWKSNVIPWIHSLQQCGNFAPKALATFEGHEDWVRSIAFSTNGRQLASGSDDQTVRIWDTEYGLVQHTLPIPRAYIYSVAISSRNEVAAGTDNSVIMIWDLITGKENRKIGVSTSPVYCLDFSPDGSKLAATVGKSINIWNLDAQEDSECIQRGAYVKYVSFSVDGKMLVSTGSNDIFVEMLDDPQSVRVFKGHTDKVNCAIFSHDMKLVASASEDQTCGIWDVKSGDRMFTLTYDSAVRSIAFSPNNMWLMSSTSSTLRFWNLETRTEHHVIHLLESDILSIACPSTSSTYIASSMSSGDILLWPIPDGSTTNQGDSSTAMAPTIGDITDLTVSPNGKIVAFGTYDGSVQLWHPETGQCIPIKMSKVDTSSVRSLSFSPDGCNILITCKRYVGVCNTTGAELRVLKDHDNWTRFGAWSAKGRYIATASDDKCIRIWSMEGEKDSAPVVLDKQHQDYVRAVAFSLDGKYLVSGGDDRKVLVWKKTSERVWEKKHTLSGHVGYITSVMFMPDSRRILSFSLDKTLRIWDLEKEDNEAAKIDVSRPPYRIRHDAKSSDFIMTDTGAQSLNKDASDPQTPSWSPYRLKYISDRGRWAITFENRYVLLLPQGISREASYVDGYRIIIGAENGQVLVINLSKKQVPKGDLGFIA